MNDNVTVLTERGQVSVPAPIRRLANLRPGQHLRWEQVSSTELRVVVDPPERPLGAFAALGYARRWLVPGMERTDEVLRDLREGETD